MRKFHLLLAMVSLVGISPSRAQPVQKEVTNPSHGVESLKLGQTVHSCLPPCGNETKTSISQKNQKTNQYIEITTDDQGKRQFKIPTGESPGLQFVELRTSQQAAVKRGCDEMQVEDDCRNKVEVNDADASIPPLLSEETQDNEEYEIVVDEQYTGSGSGDEELGSGDDGTDESFIAKRETIHGEQDELGSNSDDDLECDSDEGSTEDMSSAEKQSANIDDSQGDRIVRSESIDAESFVSGHGSSDEKDENSTISQSSDIEDNDSKTDDGNKIQKSSGVDRQFPADAAQEKNSKNKEFLVTREDESVTDDDTTVETSMAKRENSGTSSEDDEEGIKARVAGKESSVGESTGSKSDSEYVGDESRQFARAKRELAKEEKDDKAEPEEPVTKEDVVRSMKKLSLSPLAVFGN